MTFYVLGSFLFGAAYSVVVVYFYQAVTERRPLRASAYDLLIGGLAVAPFQAWSMAGNSVWVLMAEVLGSAVGTYFALRKK